MFSLVLAGEAIFLLPFHVSRHFRPTFVEVFGVDQTSLGMLGTIYGVVATFAYIFGGGFADRFQPRKLLAASLAATGLSGLYMATLPSYAGMCGLFAFWGLSTILPFWSALIRAVRDWGGETRQGAAFGVLDGGRGLMAGVLGMLAFALFSLCFPERAEPVTDAQRVEGLKSVIYVYTAACFIAAACVYACIPDSKMDRPQANGPRPGRSGPAAADFWECLRMPAVWLQAAVIVAAYSLFKARDFYTQYARDVWEWTEVETAGLSTLSIWLRPAAAVGAGLLADRLSATRVVCGCFLMTAAAYVSFIFSSPPTSPMVLLWINVVVSCLGMFALRGGYFALLEESRIPRRMTGTAVGVVSFIGFTPEMFMPLLGGMIIDHWGGGLTGYRVVFGILLGMSVLGVAAALLLRRAHR
ncbi:MAG: MFS transporter [Planctomycetota bacterium]